MSGATPGDDLGGAGYRGGYEVDVDALTAHATMLGSIAQRLAPTVEAARSIPLGGNAFGALNFWVADAFFTGKQEALEKTLSDCVAAVDGSGAAVLEDAGVYTEVDTDAQDQVRTSGGGL